MRDISASFRERNKIKTFQLRRCWHKIRGPFAKFVDWRQCAAVMQEEAVALMLSCSGGGNVVVE
jgi:hypothetical protein